MSNTWALFQNPQQILSEIGILTSELEGNGWEDLF